MSNYFFWQVISACLAQIARRVVLLLALCLLWPLLAASAPAQACTEASAAFVLRQAVARDVQSNGATISVPAGYAVGWSCTSIEDARSALAAQVAQIK